MTPIRYTLSLIYITFMLLLTTTIPINQLDSTPVPTSTIIVAPETGSVVSGLVQVLGSAMHPQFLNYQLEYGPEPNPNNFWIPASGIVESPVPNGLLGIWDTATAQDGIHQLRLRMTLRDGTILVTVVNNIHISNQSPTLPLPICAWDRTFGENSGNGRVLVLIQGFTSSAPNHQDMVEAWAAITTKLSSLYDYFLYFSYDRNDPTHYAIRDTVASIFDHHIPLLADTLASCMARGGRSFDLIGHSMGGIVAWEYLKAYGLHSDQAGWVRNVITLDSPINGTSITAEGGLVSLLSEFAFSDPDCTQVGSGPVDRFSATQCPAAIEMQKMYEDREQLIALNSDLASQLHQNGIQVITMSNLTDLVVSTEDAIISGYNRIYAIVGGISDIFIRHSNILTYGDALDDIFSILSAPPPELLAQIPDHILAITNEDLIGVWLLENARNLPIEFTEDGLIIKRAGDSDSWIFPYHISEGELLISVPFAPIQHIKLAPETDLNAGLLLLQSDQVWRLVRAEDTDSANNVEIPSGAQEAIERHAQQYGLIANYGGLPQNWRVSSAQLAPSPQNLSPFSPAYGAEEIWCITIEPGIRADYNISRGRIIKSFLVWRKGLLWTASSWNLIFTETVFPEISCSNYADEVYNR